MSDDKAKQIAQSIVQIVDGSRTAEFWLPEIIAILRREYPQPCNIPACNCGSWHAHYGLPERMREIEEILDEAGHPLSNKNGNLISKALKELVRELALLRTFAQRIMTNWPEGGVDGGELQDTAVDCGLLEPNEVSEPCGENCRCAEYGDFPVTCYRPTTALQLRVSLLIAMAQVNLEAPNYLRHEVLHTTSIFMEMVEEKLLEHPTIQGNPVYRYYADTAVVALNELYQVIGRDHLGGTNV